jgi:glucoamylase
LAWSSIAGAQTESNLLAPGAPGKDAQWAGAGKKAVGTSNTLESKVWFTLGDGGMTEVYYPTVDVANTRMLEFVVVSGNGAGGASRRVETESTDATHQTEVLDARALSFRQINTARSGAWTITKTYTTDPERHTVLIDVRFESRAAGTPYALYVYYDPSLHNSGMHDSAWTEEGALLASDADKASALVASRGFDFVTNGYFQTESDGLFQLRQPNSQTTLSESFGTGTDDKREARSEAAVGYARAVDGNVVQLARVKADAPFTLALGFGREPVGALTNARASLSKGFARARVEYETGWHEYLKSLRRVEPKYQAQFDMVAMVLKAHEDKTFRGAMIASLSVPWGGGANANEPNVGGYHLVWSRDLYQVATAFYALGDKASADRALDYMFRVQQKADGSFPQNSWLDGRPFWGSLQLDEVAYPLILAYQLGRTDNQTWTKHAKRAADFIVKHGPYTPQERWEEESGYSPSTIAAEIAGLVCAAEIARRNDDQASVAIYTAAADEWTRNVEAWTATTSGKHGDGNYYLRITENSNPNDGEPRELNNGAGTFDEREIVDAGFLELVRLGIKSPQDPLVAKSVAVVDKVIRVETPNGATFYRYNHDGYGEMDDGRPWNFDGNYTGRGRPWVLLAGERGEYELMRGEREAARRRLDAMLGFANEGFMLPEQIWDKQASPRAEFRFGEGTGSATPLAWSMAGYVRLAASIAEGRNIMLPDIVAARYVKQPPPPDADAASWDDTEVRLDAGASLPLRGRLSPRTRAFVMVGDERRELPVDAEGNYNFGVPVAAGDTRVVFATLTPSGATSFRRIHLRGIAPEEKERVERAAQTPEFVARLKSASASPIIEGDKATFVYRGKARRVEVVGDFTSWSPGGMTLSAVPGTDIKYITRTFPLATRAEYKLIADGEWMLDPLNPKKLDNGVGGENSFFTMPNYRPSAYIRDDAAGHPVSPQENGQTRANTPRNMTTLDNDGVLDVVIDEVPSRLLGGARKIGVYLPRGYKQSRQSYPVLYVQDGLDYMQRGQAALIAHRLIEQKKVAPFIIVFVNPVDRMKEYWANDTFADFMAKELVPFIDSEYRTRAERQSRALLGASLGGVISVWTALRHPDIFARIGGQSSAFQIDEERVVTALARLDAPRRDRPMKFYLDVGRLEPLLDINRRVHAMLAAKGYKVIYREADAGHNYTAWRDLLADAYVALWRD